MPSPSIEKSALEFVAETNLPTVRGTFRVRAYRDPATGTEPLAIVSGDVQGRRNVLVRVHDECLTSEVLGSLKCDCREQLEAALERIRAEGGVVVYLRQEGRGIGLANKIAAYSLQERGLDTVDANRALGLPDDARSYDAAAAILADLGLTDIRLLTNNPRKIDQLTALGVSVAERVPHHVAPNLHSLGYLVTKRARMGHLAEPADEPAGELALASK
jgi:3,4-dihydroxy 2-butanone 4-phosphate synthase / GTP cyclohydrolase II